MALPRLPSLLGLLALAAPSAGELPVMSIGWFDNRADFEHCEPDGGGCSPTLAQSRCPSAALTTALPPLTPSCISMLLCS